MSFKIAKLQGYVYDHLEVDENGAARVLLTQDTLENIRLRMLKQLQLSEHLAELILLRLGLSLLNKLMVTSVCVCAVKSPYQ